MNAVIIRKNVSLVMVLSRWPVLLPRNWSTTEFTNKIEMMKIALSIFTSVLLLNLSSGYFREFSFEFNTRIFIRKTERMLDQILGVLRQISNG